MVSRFGGAGYHFCSKVLRAVCRGWGTTEARPAHRLEAARLTGALRLLTVRRTHPAGAPRRAATTEGQGGSLPGEAGALEGADAAGARRGGVWPLGRETSVGRRCPVQRRRGEGEAWRGQACESQPGAWQVQGPEAGRSGARWARASQGGAWAGPGTGRGLAGWGVGVRVRIPAAPMPIGEGIAGNAVRTPSPRRRVRAARPRAAAGGGGGASCPGSAPPCVLRPGRVLSGSASSSADWRGGARGARPAW